MRPRLLPLLLPIRQQSSQYLHTTSQSRSFTAGSLRLSSQPPPPSIAPSKWLSHTKSRLGKCIMFGLSEAQTAEVGKVCKILGEEWKELVAGREGFLTGRKRAGLSGHRVVWGEMDVMGHVNNVTYIRYAESARINWAMNYAIHIDPEHKDEWMELWTPKGDGLILKSIKTEYKFPMSYPDSISVFHKLHAPPSPKSNSFILDVLILSELKQRPAARCKEDIVVYDYKKGVKINLRPFMLEAFQGTWEEQEKEKTRVMERIEEVERIVGEVERGSWGREGAVEDMGGASR